ncbi:MAG: hypothetical protein HQL74_11475 [Magnetococcales bacterium]|nr:hypothetical protein [Magnetococcales bacterium]
MTFLQIRQISGSSPRNIFLSSECGRRSRFGIPFKVFREAVMQKSGKVRWFLFLGFAFDFGFDFFESGVIGF